MNPIEDRLAPLPEDKTKAPTLTPEARRALEEAEARRREAGSPAAAPREVGGRNGPDPARYGDWEKNGITSDF